MCGCAEPIVRKEVISAIHDKTSDEDFADRIYTVIVTGACNKYSYGASMDSLPALATVAARRRNPIYGFVSYIFERHRAQIFQPTDHGENGGKIYGRIFELLKLMVLSGLKSVRSCAFLLGM